jgi:hypothetical protein
VETVNYTVARQKNLTPALHVNPTGETITYSLKNGNGNSHEYYSDVAQFTDNVLSNAENHLTPLVKQFEQHIEQTQLEPLRSSEEYLLELLCLGVLWIVYASQAVHFSSVASGLFHALIALRQRYQWLKPGIDVLRGILATLLLVSDPSQQETEVLRTRRNLTRLLNWLSVTGEFKEEVKRFQNWQRFFATLPDRSVAKYLEEVVTFACWFKGQSKSALGKYTTYVEPFLQEAYPKTYRWREDVIFCGRQEVEYHLIMVGAEILNRAFREEFLQTPRKAVLLPACMRAEPAAECQALKVGLDMICMGCTPTCRIRQFNRLGREIGFEVYIVSHSSDFTKWLERWRDTREFGVIGVACILNLFTGGYEMKDLNIPSQCVLLDYCGCQNHWHQEGIPTDIDQEQLLFRLGIKTAA